MIVSSCFRKVSLKRRIWKIEGTKIHGTSESKATKTRAQKRNRTNIKFPPKWIPNPSQNQCKIMNKAEVYF